MLKKRIIPCLLLKDWQLTKSVKFKEYRTIGHPKVTARIYNSRNVDELLVLDVDASRLGEELNYAALSMIAEECFMPLTLGGGVKSIDVVQKLLNIGADKIAINSEALENIEFVEEVSKKYGAQCVVVSIDVKYESGCYRIRNNTGELLDIDLVKYIQSCEKMGAGELLITNVDHDGMQMGYDLKLLDLIHSHVSIPVIINGGAGDLNHCLEAFKHGADAISAASIFQFSHITPNEIRKYLFDHSIPVRGCF